MEITEPGLFHNSYLCLTLNIYGWTQSSFTDLWCMDTRFQWSSTYFKPRIKNVTRAWIEKKKSLKLNKQNCSNSRTASVLLTSFLCEYSYFIFWVFQLSGWPRCPFIEFILACSAGWKVENENNNVFAPIWAFHSFDP